MSKTYITFDDESALLDGLPSGVTFEDGGIVPLFSVIGSSMPEGAREATPDEMEDFYLRNLNTLKESLRADINKERNSRVDSGVEFPPESGDLYDSDETSQKNITGAVTMYSIAVQAGKGDEYVQPWIKLNGNVIELDGQGVVGLGVTLGRHVGKHRVEAAGFKKQLEGATDIDSANAIFEAYKATAEDEDEAVEA